MSAAPESPIGMFTTDRNLGIRSWDDWLAKVTGIPAEEAFGRPLGELFPDLGERGLLCRFENVLTGVIEVLAPAFHRYLLACPPAIPSKRFSHMRQRVTIAPLREDECVVGIMVTIEDVTARVEKEQDIAEQLHSPDEETRLRAAEAFSRGDLLEPVQPLVGALSDESWRVRGAAVAGLGRRGDAESVAALLRALRFEHRNLSVLNSALQVLSMMEMDTITPLVNFLKDPDPELRIYAALALGETRRAEPIPALLEALNDSDSNVRYHAVEALGKLRAAKAVEALSSIVESRDFFLAFPALDALVQIGNPCVCGHIVPLLKDDLLKEPAAEALGKLGDQEIVQPLVNLLNEPDAPVHAVVRALTSLFDRYEKLYEEGAYIADIVHRAIDETGIRNLIASLEDASDEQLRLLVPVMGWLRSESVQRAVIRQLGRPTVRKEIVEALVRYGRNITGLLVRELGSEDLDARRQAVLALGRIGDPESVPALVEALKKDDELTISSADALAQIGDRRAFEDLLGFLDHPDSAVRMSAISALNSIGHPDMPERISKLLVDRAPRLRDSAVRIAGYFGYPQCADLLFERCRDEDETVQATAIEHIIYLDDERVLPTLLDSIRSGWPKVRQAAARSMAHLNEAVALPHLLQALSDSDEWVRYFAVRSIGKFGFESAALEIKNNLTESIIRLIREDPAGPVRVAAVAILGRLGGTDAISIVAPLAREKDPDLARVALQALGLIDTEEALPYLMTALRSTDTATRRNAVRALSGCRAREAVSALQWAAKDKDSLVSRRAVEALAFMETTDSIAALLNLTVDSAIRENAIDVLAKLGEESVEEISRGLASGHLQVRCAVVEVLARMKRPRATEWIVGALEDEEPTVRILAARALGLLGSRLGEERLRKLALSDPETSVRDAARASLRAC